MDDAATKLSQLDDLIAMLANHVASIAEAVKSCQDEWLALGKVGGQRADHAATYLNQHLKLPLRNLKYFANNCLATLEALNAHPFGTTPEKTS